MHAHLLTDEMLMFIVMILAWPEVRNMETGFAQKNINKAPAQVTCEIFIVEFMWTPCICVFMNFNRN